MATRKRFPILPALFGAVGIAVLLTVGGFVFAATQETHDAFCASCHSQPETTFVANAQGGQGVDLASYHTRQKTRCIDCHSGQGLSGRLSAELMGARNAFRWYTGTAVQPAPLTIPIGDASCLKCHADVVQRGFQAKETITVPGVRGEGEGGFGERGPGHWHTFMTRWQAADKNAGTCISCHSGHTPGESAQAGFMNSQNVRQTCQACHQAIRREGEGGGG